MAIAHDAATRFPDSGTATVLDTTTGDRTFTHAGAAGAQGAVVMVSGASATSVVSGVLYGGTSMSLVESCSDTSEAGHVDIYFLGNLGLLSLGGTQTVTLQGCTSTGKAALCSTVTSATGYCGLDNIGSVDTTTSSNPTVTFSVVANAMVYGGLVGGASAPTSYTAGTGESLFTGNPGVGADFGSNSAQWERSTTAAGGGSYTFNFAYVTSDDWAIAAISIKEQSAPTAIAYGEVTIADAGVPTARSSHQIKLRAQKASGTGTVTVSAALYEGASNRSGDLTTGALTTSLAEYDLAISEANATNISDYSALSIRWWANSSTGDTIVVTVADIWLELPVSNTFKASTGRATAKGGDASFSVTGGGTTVTAVSGLAAARGASVTVAETLIAAAGTAKATGGSSNVGRTVIAVNGPGTAWGSSVTLTDTLTAASGTARAAGGSKSLAVTVAATNGRANASGGVAALSLTIVAATGTATGVGGTSNFSVTGGALTVTVATGYATATGGTSTVAETLLAASGGATATGGASNIGRTVTVASGAATASGGSSTVAETLLAAFGAAVATGGASTPGRAVLAVSGLAAASGGACLLTVTIVAATGAATATGGSVVESVSSPGVFLAAGGAAQALGAATNVALTLTAATGAAIARGGATLTAPSVSVASGAAVAYGGTSNVNYAGAVSTSGGFAKAVGGSASLSFTYVVANGSATARGGVVSLTLRLVASGGTAFAQGRSMLAFVGAIPDTHPPLGGVYDETITGGVVSANDIIYTALLGDPSAILGPDFILGDGTAQVRSIIRSGVVTPHAPGGDPLESNHSGRVSHVTTGGIVSGSSHGGVFVSPYRGGRVIMPVEGATTEPALLGGRVNEDSTGGTVIVTASGGRVTSVARGGIINEDTTGGSVVTSKRGGEVQVPVVSGTIE